MSAARELARQRWDRARPVRDPKTMGERLRAAREQAKLTQAQVAASMGVAILTVKRWEGDISEPVGENLAELALVLRANLDWIVTGDSPSTGGSI